MNSTKQATNYRVLFGSHDLAYLPNSGLSVVSCCFVLPPSRRVWPAWPCLFLQCINTSIHCLWFNHNSSDARTCCLASHRTSVLRRVFVTVPFVAFPSLIRLTICSNTARLHVWKQMWVVKNAAFMLLPPQHKVSPSILVCIAPLLVSVPLSPNCGLLPRLNAGSRHGGLRWDRRIAGAWLWGFQVGELRFSPRSWDPPGQRGSSTIASTIDVVVTGDRM